MKNFKANLLISILTLSLFACGNDPDPETIISGELRVVGMVQSTSSTTIYNYGIESKAVASFSIDCLVMGSTKYDPATNSLAYVDCNQMFRMVNPLTGDEVKSFEVAGNMSEIEIDHENNRIIGYYYNHDTEETRLATYDLSNGQQLSDNQLNGIVGFYTGSTFYNSDSETYFLITSENELKGYNPETGNSINSTSLPTASNYVHFNTSVNQLVVMDYNENTERNSIHKIDLNTGQNIQSVEVNELNYYVGLAYDYDSDLDAFVLVKMDRTVVFIDSNTGEITESSQLDGDVQALAFYRAQ